MKRLASFLILFGCASVNAHEDTPFGLLDDGTVRGIPESYGRVKLIADFSGSQMCGTPAPTLTVLFGDVTTAVPVCIMESARDSSWDAVHAYGSWYHEGYVEGLPPYLAIAFSPSHHLMFNLETGELLLDETASLGRIDVGVLCTSWEDADVAAQACLLEDDARPASSQQRRK